MPPQTTTPPPITPGVSQIPVTNTPPQQAPLVQPPSVIPNTTPQTPVQPPQPQQPTPTPPAPGSTLSQDQVKQLIQNAPAGVQPADIVNGLISKGYQLEGYPGQTPNLPPGQLPDTGSFVGNAFNSLGNLLGSLGNVIAHPIKTVEGLGNIAVGAGEDVANSLFGGTFNNAQTQAFNGLISYFGNRYGGSNVQQVLGNIGRTFYTDPVGALADLSVALGGVEGIAGKIGDLSELAKANTLAEAGGTLSEVDALRGTSVASKISDIAGKGAELTNPLTPVAKIGEGIVNAGNKVVASALGIPSKIGYEGANAIIDSARGVEGAPSLEEMTNVARSGVDTQQLAGELNDTYDSIRKQQLADYGKGLDQIDQNYRETNLQQKGNSDAIVMQNNKLPADANAAGQVAGETFPLSTQGIKGVMTSVFKDHGIALDDEGKISLANSPIPDSEVKRLQSIYDNVQNWSDMTPNGLKNLVRKIGGYYKPMAQDDEINSIIAGMKSRLNGYLQDRVPEFKELNATYRETSQLLKGEKGTGQISLRTLGLGPKSSATADTILQRVLKAARSDDTYTQGLVRTLENTTGHDFDAIAIGKSANGWTPHGLLAGGLEIGTFIHPELALGLIMSSPRVAFEFLRGIGLGEAKIAELTQGITSARALLTAKAGQINSASSSGSGNPVGPRPPSKPIRVTVPRSTPPTSVPAPSPTTLV